MARSLCGVPGLINDGSAHSRTGSETTVNQGSKQVTVASYTTPMEHYDGIYSMPYIDFQSPANQESEDESEDNNGSEKIILSKRIADYIFGREECAIWNPDHLAKTCTYMVYTCQRHPCPMLGDRHVADMFVNLTICVDMYIPNPKITNMS